MIQNAIWLNNVYNAYLQVLFFKFFYWYTQYPDYVFMLFSLYYVYWCWDDILKGSQRAGPKKAHVSATGINFIYSLVGSTSADGHGATA